MSGAAQSGLLALFGLLITAYVTWLNNRQQNKRGEDDQALRRIEAAQQAQEDEITRLKGRVAELEGSLGAAAARIRLALGYIRTLLRHIEHHDGPNPPEPPEGLDIT